MALIIIAIIAIAITILGRVVRRRRQLRISRASRRPRRHGYPPKAQRSSGPSRRAIRRSAHLQRCPGSRLSSPGLGRLAILHEGAKLLLKVVSQDLASIEEAGEALLQRHRTQLAVMPERVASMGEGRFARLLTRLGNEVRNTPSSEVLRRRALRAARRQARRAEKSRRKKAFLGELAEIGRRQRLRALEAKWAAERAARETRWSDQRDLLGAPNQRCIEGTWAFERSGRLRVEDRLWLHSPRNQLSPRERAVVDGGFAGWRVHRPHEVLPQKRQALVRHDVEAHEAWAFDPAGVLGNICVAIARKEAI